MGFVGAPLLLVLTRRGSKQTFFHFTQTEDEVSLLLDADLVPLFPPGALVVAGA